ncbi:MAG: sugar-binding transcriptional regulator [Pseudothermotoga sp.]
MAFKDHDDLVTIVAWMYYMDGLTQEKIAQEIGISRTKVSRLLSEAYEKGIVQFRITKSLPEYYLLERELKHRFNLKIAVVAPQNGDSLGQFAAESLFKFINEQKPRRVGLGWSTTVSLMAPYLSKGIVQTCQRCSVHDLTGSFIGQRNPYSISWRVADAIDARYVPLPVPVLVENPTLKEESTISNALKEAEKVDIAFVGMGCMGTKSTLLKTGLVSKEMMNDLEMQGCVGEVLMRFFDKEGRPMKSPLDDRIVSIDWPAIKNIPVFVVIAAGEEKVAPLRAALFGGWVSGLITDVQTAKRLLE